MRGPVSGSGPGWPLLCILVLAATLVILSGCSTTSSGDQGSRPVPGLQSKIVHVPGTDHGLIFLVEMSTCPHCASTRALLDQLGVDYWYIDLNTLNQTEVLEVFNSVNRICGQGETVPRLVIRGGTCILGDQPDKIREAIG